MATIAYRNTGSITSAHVNRFCFKSGDGVALYGTEEVGLVAAVLDGWVHVVEDRLDEADRLLLAFVNGMTGDFDCCPFCPGLGAHHDTCPSRRHAAISSASG